MIFQLCQFDKVTRNKIHNAILFDRSDWMEFFLNAGLHVDQAEHLQCLFDIDGMLSNSRRLAGLTLS